MNLNNRYDMKLKKFDKRFLPMLWIGLAIWAVSYLALFIMQQSGVALDSQSTLMDMGKYMFSRMPIFTVLLICVLQPFFEEVSFRLWAVGKKWMTILCLVFMILFMVGEIALWGLLIGIAFLLVWLLVKDRFWQVWLNAVLSSVGFTVCHISGFQGFSVGSMLGLLDIFGMALVMCWLVVNVGFWWSVLLHCINNSLGVLGPLLALAQPVMVQGDGYTMTIEPLHPFADNKQEIFEGSPSQWMDIPYDLDSLCLVGEPAELACFMAEMADTSFSRHYRWEGKGLSFQERIKVTVKYDSMQLPDYGKLFVSLMDGMTQYDKDLALSAEESDEEACTIWLNYPDGRSVRLEESDEDPAVTAVRVEESRFGRLGLFIVETELIDDSIEMEYYYALPKTNPMAKQMQSADLLLYGNELTYVPDHKVKVTTIK